jgi:hypothetical protein
MVLTVHNQTLPAAWHGLLGIDCQPPPLQQRLIDLGVALGRLVASQVLIELRAVMTPR